jgi:hypothetical protein
MMVKVSQQLHPNGLTGASKCLSRKDWRFLLRKLTLLAVICGLLFLAGLAQAQQADAMFGLGTVMSSGTCNVNSNNVLICPERGGLYPSISADVIFHKRVGFNFETTWRASQASIGGQPYRPIILDFNGMYQPKLGRKAGLDLFGGVGWQSTRYYLPFCTGTFSCNNFVSSHHFLVDAGAGLRYYVRGHIFVRPEVHFYNILNNTNDFSSNNIVRVGASIGYTIGPD